MSRSARIAGLRPSARKVALLVLMETERGMPLQAALSRALQHVPLSAEVRRQATDLAYWCLRAQTRCCFVLRRVFKNYAHFAPEIRHLLLAACAALLFQEGAPAYAVVHETVEDIRLLSGKGIAGAANGGLRSLLRLNDGPFQPMFYEEAGDADSFSAFCRLTSFPEDLGRLLVRECGEDRARAIMKHSFARPSPCVRLNPTKPGFERLKAELQEQGAEPLPGLAGTTGLFFPRGAKAPCLSDLVKEGRLSLQAAGSQLALAALSLDAEAPIWDACCGFGGKTTALLEAGCHVSLASDVSWARLSSLPGECARLGLQAPCALLADGRRPPLARWDGTIVLDVPCSGLGVLARRPDIKLRARSLAQYVQTQKNLLERALTLVPAGRDVLYITCTVTRSENGALVREVCHSFDATLAEEWATPENMPFESMYAARIRA